MEAVRTCVGCSQRSNSSDLIRIKFVASKLVIDSAGKFAGRGAWLHPNQDCLEQSIRRNSLSRALRITGSLETKVLVQLVEEAEKMLATNE